MIRSSKKSKNKEHEDHNVFHKGHNELKTSNAFLCSLCSLCSIILLRQPHYLFDLFVLLLQQKLPLMLMMYSNVQHKKSDIINQASDITTILPDANKLAIIYLPRFRAQADNYIQILQWEEDSSKYSQFFHLFLIQTRFPCHVQG